MLSRKIRMGMVGGGRGAFIGGVHRTAAAIDGQIELVCGAFSSDPKKARLSGKDLFLPNDRVYTSYQEMFEKEAALPEGERMDFVSIVTPNVTHFPIAEAALKGGFHVMSDKPATFTLAEAKKLRTLVKRTGLQYGLTHPYGAYPLVKEARDMVREGTLGEIRKVIVEYPQGWLATDLEQSDQKQAAWRVDPKRSGISNCMGDIGTHAENLAEAITGLQISELCADLTAFGKGRTLDTDGNVLLRFSNGARGILHASQILVGEENGLNIRIYGTKGSLKWQQLEPNTLLYSPLGEWAQVIRAGDNHPLGKAALAHVRTPGGHPEGFFEAFANIYRNYALALSARLSGKKPKAAHFDFPTIDDGVRGMAFIEAVVKSSKSKQKWTKFPKV